LRSASSAPSRLRWLPSGGPAIVGSAPLSGHTIGNVIVIGPRLRFLSGDVNHDGYTNEYDLYFMKSLNGVERGENKGFGYDRYLDYDANGKIDSADVNVWLAFSNDAFSLTEFFRIIFRDWGLLPLEFDPNYPGMIAHLGLNGLAAGNNTDHPNTFLLRLPFKTLPRDPAYAKYFPSYPAPGNIIQADFSNILGERQALFIPLDVPVAGDVDQNGCVDLNDVKLAGRPDQQ
jgi:hypothetical protein